MKRIIIIFTAILVLIFSFSACYAADINFADIKTDDWFYKNLEELVQNNIASGYPDGNFKPGNTLKFEEFIKMLVVAVSDETIEQKEGQEWYQVYIDEAMEGKYITEQQKSHIGQNIDRKTMAEILYNVLAEKEDITAYTDAELEYLASRLTDIDKADAKTLTINAMGVISGYPDGTFKPTGTLIRAEAVAVISRVINSEMRNPVEIILPDTRTLDELPPVDLSHLYDYPTLLGKTVEEENGWSWDNVNVYSVVDDGKEYMNLMHNRDYKTFGNRRMQVESEVVYLLNAYKEYKGMVYDAGLRSYNLEFFKNDKEVYDFILAQNNWIENFFDAWAKDTIDNQVQVQSEFYTDEYLLISADGYRAARGTLRIKYSSHKDPNNIKYELDLVESETQEKGKRVLGLPESSYGIYLDFDDIPELEVGKWYEIDMDLVLRSGGVSKGLEDIDRKVYNYKYIYPIAIRQVD